MWVARPASTSRSRPRAGSILGGLARPAPGRPRAARGRAVHRTRRTNTGSLFTMSDGRAVAFRPDANAVTFERAPPGRARRCWPRGGAHRARLPRHSRGAGGPGPTRTAAERHTGARQPDPEHPGRPLAAVASSSSVRLRACRQRPHLGDVRLAQPDAHSGLGLRPGGLGPDGRSPSSPCPPSGAADGAWIHGIARKFGFTITVVTYAVFAVMLAFWGALSPWSG